MFFPLFTKDISFVEKKINQIFQNRTDTGQTKHISSYIHLLFSIKWLLFKYKFTSFKHINLRELKGKLKPVPCFPGKSWISHMIPTQHYCDLCTVCVVRKSTWFPSSSAHFHYDETGRFYRRGNTEWVCQSAVKTHTRTQTPSSVWLVPHTFRTIWDSCSVRWWLCSGTKVRLTPMIFFSYLSFLVNYVKIV